MSKKSTPDIPDGFPEEARQHWPNLEDWPTADAVREFVKVTKRRPNERLAVLTGLRQLSESDLSYPWSWVGVYVPVVIVLLSVPSPVPWLSTSLLVVGLIAIAVVLARLLWTSAEVDQRRRRAIGWLRAFEDAINTQKE